MERDPRRTEQDGRFLKRRPLLTEGQALPERRPPRPVHIFHQGRYIESLERTIERADGTVVKLWRVTEDEEMYWKVSVGGTSVRYFASNERAEQVFGQLTTMSAGQPGHDAHPANF